MYFLVGYSTDQYFSQFEFGHPSLTMLKAIVKSGSGFLISIKISHSLFWKMFRVCVLDYFHYPCHTKAGLSKQTGDTLEIKHLTSIGKIHLSHAQ